MGETNENEVDTCLSGDLHVEKAKLPFLQGKSDIRKLKSINAGRVTSSVSVCVCELKLKG
jgi:hypothetical protein